MPSVAWALQERDAKGADSSTKEGHLIPCRIGGFFDDPVSFKASHFTRGKDGAPSPITPPLSADADKGDQDTLIAFTAKDHGADAGEISPTLRAGGHTTSHANGGVMPAIAFNARQDPDSWSERTGPLDTDGTSQAVSLPIQGVRRLTAIECLRLQGFDDNWMAGFGFADSTIYRATGNAVNVAVAKWIARRIVKFFP